MLSALFTGMHRCTRSSGYVDRKKMRQQVKANRPGHQGFSFTGDYPEAADWQPVEATRKPRCYTQVSQDSGIYAAVDGQINERVPLVGRDGLSLGLGITVLVFFVALLAAVWIAAYSVNAGLAKRLNQQSVRMETLVNDAASLESEIALRCSSVNVRQEAARIGLKSSRGINPEYVSVPAGAVIDPASYGLRLDTASIFGQ